MKKGGLLRKNLTLFLILIFLSGLLFLGEQRGWISSARGAVEQPILALEKQIYSLSISISQYLNIFSSKRSKEKEIMMLQGQLRQLASEKNQLSVCLEENEKMRRLLGAPLPPGWKFLPAKVVGISGKMMIDKGQKDGVRKGMMVVSENILVGKIISVTPKTALVQLPTDPASKIPVVVKKPNSQGIQARGLLLAQSGKLIVDRVLQEEDVRVGDLVLTGGEEISEFEQEGMFWRPDLLIGQIQEVIGSEAAIHKQAQISPLIDYQNLKTVFLVIP